MDLLTALRQAISLILVLYDLSVSLILMLYSLCVTVVLVGLRQPSVYGLCVAAYCCWRYLKT